MARRAKTKISTSSGTTPYQSAFAYCVAILIFGWGILHSCYRSGMERWHGMVDDHPQAVAQAKNWERVPPRPTKYVTDLTGLLDADRASRLNETLAAFERQTSNQIVVYVAQNVPYATTLEECANEAFRQWEIGRKGRDNGVLFLVFTGDRQMRIEVGYGLEGVLTDAKAKRITSTVVKPFFQREDYTSGVEAGARAIIDVVRGEGYEGSGRTFAESAKLAGITVKNGLLSFIGWLIMIVLIGTGVVVTGTTLSFLQRLFGLPDPFRGGGSSGSWSSGGSSSSYSSSSSSFSGGGGSSGGGGASDSW